jgi:hypothetical protein
VSSFSTGRSQEAAAGQSPEDDWRLERLIDRLPCRLGAAVRFLRQPSGRWLRIPAGLLLILGGVLSFLPILGIWMLPLGLALLAEDFPVLRSWRSRILDWVECRHPEWLNSAPHPHDRK